MDALEELTTRTFEKAYARIGMADDILVNSQFTRSIFKKAFPSIQVDPKVLYPGIHFDSYSSSVDLDDARVQKLIRFGFLSYSSVKQAEEDSINQSV